MTEPAQRCALRGAWDTQIGLTDVETKTQYISVGDARTISYVYDDLGRLVEADYSSGEKFEYQYDAVGNRTVSAALAGAARDTVTLGGGPVATSYTYDAANRLTNAGGVAYSWDERGNLRSDGTYTSAALAGAARDTWSAAGRLITTTDGTTTVQFGSVALAGAARDDGDGNRLERQVEGGTLTTYTQDVGLGLPEAIAERRGTAVTLYLHPSAGSGQALPSVIAWDDGTDWHYFNSWWIVRCLAGRESSRRIHLSLAKICGRSGEPEPPGDKITGLQSDGR